MYDMNEIKKSHSLLFSRLWDELKVDLQMEPEQVTDDYWQKMMDRYVAISKPYHGTQFDTFAKNFVMTVVSEVERINTEKWKSNQGK